MDSFDPFAGFETELKGSLPKQNGGANNAVPMPGGGGGGDVNSPKAVKTGCSSSVKSPTSTLQSKSIMSFSLSQQQQPMTNKGMMPVMGSGSYVQPPPQQQQRNAPMPSSSFVPANFQPQQQQKAPMMMMQQQQQPQWGGGNNNWQHPQQPQKPMPFQQQPQQMMQMQYPASAPFQQQQQQQQQFQQPFAMKPVMQNLQQQKPAVMPNQQQQPFSMQQQKPMQQKPPVMTQQKPIAGPAPQQQHKPVVAVAAQQQQKPVATAQKLVAPKQQKQEEAYEYDAVFARIPSIVHTKSATSSNDGNGGGGLLPHSNSDGEISQFKDDDTMTSFCPPPPPPSVAPPPPPPAAEQAAFQQALIAPSPSSPSTNLADYDVFGGLFDSAHYPAATSTPPSTPYDLNHMKSMDSGPDGYLASNPSIDDDYLFSEDEDDALDDDDPFGVFGAKPSPTSAPKEKASDVSSTLGIATKKPTKGDEEPSATAKEEHDARHEKHKLPSGGEFFDCKIYTSTVGVMLFSPFELTDSLYLNMDRETVINVLGQRPVVAHMLEESAAQSVGVQLGYVLLQVNGRDVKTPLEANLAIRESSRPMNLLFYILKDPVTVAEGQYMVKYNTRDTGAPPTSRDWKPKYCVVGGIIAHSHMLNMYRSKAEYDRAVMDTQSRRPVSVKVKQFSLIGARMWNEVGKENGISKPHIRKVKYRSQMKPWNYITVLPLKKDPIKISIPGSSSDKDNGLQQLKLVHEGIRRVIHGKNANTNQNNQDSAGASSEQP